MLYMKPSVNLFLSIKQYYFIFFVNPLVSKNNQMCPITETCHRMFLLSTLEYNFMNFIERMSMLWLKANKPI